MLYVSIVSFVFYQFYADFDMEMWRDHTSIDGRETIIHGVGPARSTSRASVERDGVVIVVVVVVVGIMRKFENRLSVIYCALI